MQYRNILLKVISSFYEPFLYYRAEFSVMGMVEFRSGIPALCWRIWQHQFDFGVGTAVLVILLLSKNNVNYFSHMIFFLSFRDAMTHEDISLYFIYQLTFKHVTFLGIIINSKTILKSGKNCISVNVPIYISSYLFHTLFTQTILRN